MLEVELAPTTCWSLKASLEIVILSLLSEVGNIFDMGVYNLLVFIIIHKWPYQNM